MRSKTLIGESVEEVRARSFSETGTQKGLGRENYNLAPWAGRGSEKTGEDHQRLTNRVRWWRKVHPSKDDRRDWKFTK